MVARADLKCSLKVTSCDAMMCVEPILSSRYMRYPACFGGKPMNMPRIDERWVCCFFGIRFDLCDGSCRRKLTGQPNTFMLPILGLRPNAIKKGVVGLLFWSRSPFGRSLLRMWAACRQEWPKKLFPSLAWILIVRAIVSRVRQVPSQMLFISW